MEPLSVVLGAALGLAGGLAAAWMLFRRPLPSPAEKPPSAEPLRLLALLQRDARLLDFLMEDISGYSDAQVGAAVRDMHDKCRAVLDKHVELGPVLDQKEDSQVTVPPGFDPSAIRLTGNITGAPPFQGVLRHAGWRARRVKLPPPARGQDEFVLQPAEVELS
jgi:hypothetical protein